jgi:transcriptional regulator with PAS, ATPase and Fis domain
MFSHAHVRVRELLSAQKLLLERLATTLLEKEVLEGEELNRVIRAEAARVYCAITPRGTNFSSTDEKTHIEQVLAKLGGDKKAAAEALGMSLSSLYRKLEELQISS